MRGARTVLVLPALALMSRPTPSLVVFIGCATLDDLSPKPFQVIAFRPDRSKRSPEYDVGAFHVLGEITRMKSLPMETEDDVAATGDPMAIVDGTPFVIYACQCTAGGEARDDLAVRC